MADGDAGPAMSGGARGEGPMVLPRAFALLRLLAARPGGMNLSDIAGRLSAPKSSLSSTLKAMVEQGFLAREGALYSLGPQSYALASAILSGRTLSQVARPFLRRAAEEGGETVLLATLDPDGAHVTYVDIAESTNPVRYAVPVGTRRPLYATAGGRIFLAELGAAARRDYYAATTLETLSGEARITPAALEAHCLKLRETGISVTLGEYADDAAGFSAPIRGPGGALEAALVIAAPSSRGRREAARYEALARETARGISEILSGDESATGA